MRLKRKGKDRFDGSNHETDGDWRLERQAIGASSPLEERVEFKSVDVPGRAAAFRALKPSRHTGACGFSRDKSAEFSESAMAGRPSWIRGRGLAEAGVMGVGQKPGRKRVVSHRSLKPRAPHGDPSPNCAVVQRSHNEAEL